jgi:hypothetical protein
MRGLVFEKKYSLFQRYINRLLKIRDRNTLSAGEYAELTDCFRQRLALYLRVGKQKKIAAALRELGAFIDADRAGNRAEFHNAIFSIINALLRDLGLQGRMDGGIQNDFDIPLFRKLFRRTVLEKLNNVLVIYTDEHLLNPGYYSRAADGEYIVFDFIDRFPYGCKVMIGPFAEGREELRFSLYVPRYIDSAAGYRRDLDSNYILFLPNSISKPLDESYRLNYDIDDVWDYYIDPFSFDNQESLVRYRFSYRDLAWSLGQRAKYIYDNAYTGSDCALPIFIKALEDLDPSALYPSTPWELNEEGYMEPAASLFPRQSSSEPASPR